MITRRTVIASSLALCATSAIAAAPARRGRLKQSVSRWCYQDMPLDALCAAAARIGLDGIDLLQPAEYAVPRRHGLR
ncbi:MULTISPECIES: hypothetical protein [Sphingomonas]|nr:MULTISPECIES: hypothetical protein [Sphingomonas]MDY0966190.1 hypothetical protein [Sphingomonas sp. CFBP9021]USQ99866.1 hypothetical protein NEF64_15910 [Sphingomonas aerolata]